VVIYVKFFCDVACQKLLKLANVSQSYSKNNTGAVFLRHGVHACITMNVRVWIIVHKAYQLEMKLCLFDSDTHVLYLLPIHLQGLKPTIKKFVVH